MSRHWPLGTGSYARALAHSGLALATTVCLLIYAEYMSQAAYGEWRLGEVAGVCSIALFAVLALQGARLALFRPGVMGALVATPATEADIHHVLDPMRSIIYRLLPFIFGMAAALPSQQRGTTIGIPAVVAACLALYLALPVLALASMLLRKVLVPFGHWLVWLVAGAMILSVEQERPVAGGELARLLLWYAKWIWQDYVVLGVVCGALAYPARVWCRAAAERLLRRDELRALAFPIHAESAAKPRTTVMEAIGGGRRVRRFAFLLQEATGLYRPSDWLKAAVLWAAALVGALALAGNRPGAGSYMLVALGPMGVLLVWGTARHIRLDRWQFLSAFGPYGLPVGHLALFWTRAIALSGAYVLTGIVSVAGVAMLTPIGHGGSVTIGLAAVNIAQFWLAGLALGALISATLGAGTNRGALVATLAWVWFYAFLLLFFAGLLWGGAGVGACGLGNGLRVAFAALWAACCTGYPLMLVLDPDWPWSPFQGVPGWPFDALGWWLLALMVCVSLSLLWRAGRGRAHSRYRSLRSAGGPPIPFFRAVPTR